ncbi:Uncharacterised protein [Clostridioides difficile]|nr:hypothetical protein QAW_1428 [Clostridioides difficile CD17]EQE64350.1 hypothetical protein QCM_1162 [Clostridioides difficile CD46]EQJ50951.1 hypothetical protein QSE_1468 [Clostridioides difficile P24]OMK27913.1 hypothetical protein BER39_001247 [Clostridioides difficile]CCL85557.1 hypothetical protein BN188_270038 [Clostridioides difficile T19]
MIGLKRRNMNYIMKVGAKAQGVSVSEFRAMLQDHRQNYGKYRPRRAGKF